MLFEIHTPYEKVGKKVGEMFPQIFMIDAEYHKFGEREYIDICSFDQIKKLMDLLPACTINGSICEQKIDIIPNDWMEGQNG